MQTLVDSQLVTEHETLKNNKVWALNLQELKIQGRPLRGDFRSDTTGVFLHYKAIIFLLFRGGEEVRKSLLRSHTFTVRLIDQDASRPSAKGVTELTQSVCPFSVATHCCPSGLLRSHTFTVRS